MPPRDPDPESQARNDSEDEPIFVGMNRFHEDIDDELENDEDAARLGKLNRTLFADVSFWIAPRHCCSGEHCDEVEDTSLKLLIEACGGTVSATTQVEFCVFPPTDSVWTGALRAYAKTVSHVSTGITSLWIMDSITSGTQLSVLPYLVPPSKAPTLAPVRAVRHLNVSNSTDRVKEGQSGLCNNRRGSEDVGLLTPNSVVLSPSVVSEPLSSEHGINEDRTTLVQRTPIEDGVATSADGDDNSDADMDIDTDVESSISNMSLSPPPSSTHSEYLPNDSSSTTATPSPTLSLHQSLESLKTTTTETNSSKETTAAGEEDMNHSKNSRSSSPETPPRQLRRASNPKTAPSDEEQSPTGSLRKRPGLSRGVPLSPSKRPASSEGASSSKQLAPAEERKGTRNMSSTNTHGKAPKSTTNAATPTMKSAAKRSPSTRQARRRIVETPETDEDLPPEHGLPEKLTGISFADRIVKAVQESFKTDEPVELCKARWHALSPRVPEPLGKMMAVMAESKGGRGSSETTDSSSTSATSPLAAVSPRAVSPSPLSVASTTSSDMQPPLSSSSTTPATALPPATNLPIASSKTSPSQSAVAPPTVAPALVVVPVPTSTVPSPNDLPLTPSSSAPLASTTAPLTETPESSKARPSTASAAPISQMSNAAETDGTQTISSAQRLGGDGDQTSRPPTPELPPGKSTESNDHVRGVPTTEQRWNSNPPPRPRSPVTEGRLQNRPESRLNRPPPAFRNEFPPRSAFRGPNDRPFYSKGDSYRGMPDDRVRDHERERSRYNPHRQWQGGPRDRSQNEVGYRERRDYYQPPRGELRDEGQGQREYPADRRPSATRPPSRWSSTGSTFKQSWPAASAEPQPGPPALTINTNVAQGPVDAGPSTFPRTTLRSRLNGSLEGLTPEVNYSNRFAHLQEQMGCERLPKRPGSIINEAKDPRKRAREGGV